MEETKMEETKKKHQKGHNILVRFLNRAKNGKYSPIEESSLPYTRIKVETEVSESNEEEYYYSLR